MKAAFVTLVERRMDALVTGTDVLFTTRRHPADSRQ
jgi:hypothetical protein